MLEVIATCLDDVQKIVEGGGQRIELVSALTEGGLTPSRGLVRHAALRAGAVPIMAMLRPHAQSFVYSPGDLQIMKEDMASAWDCGAAGVVLGALTAKGELDRKALDALLADLPRGKSVTFHKALDRSAEPVETLRQLLDYPVDGILTSGGPGNILDEGNAKVLKALSALAGDRVRVIAGGGVKLSNLSQIVRKTGVRELHVGTAVRVSGDCLCPIDPILVDQFRHAADEVLEA